MSAAQHRAQQPTSIDGVLDRHRDLVLRTAQRYAAPGIDATELVRAGIEGLIDAVTRFDASCGGFDAFAAFWVRRRVAFRASTML